MTGSGGQATASYTVQGGDSLSDIATGLASSINSNMSGISVTASASGTVVTIESSPNYCTQFSSEVTGGGATTTISLSGSVPKPDFHAQQYFAYDLAANRTGVQGDSTGSFPSGLTMDAVKYSYNNVNQLTGISAGGPVRFQGTTTNPIKSAVVNPTETATIGGSVTTSDQLSISVHDKALTPSVTISYTVQGGDSTTDIATALKNGINGNGTLSSLGVTATSTGAVITISSTSSNATTYTKSLSPGATETLTLGGSLAAAAEPSPSTAFSANPQLASGSNTAAVTALSGGGTPSTNTYPISVNSVTNATLTYDNNGNMTSDGTNSYSWDAEDRLLQVTYPGTDNNTQLLYDPLGRCVKITETTAGSVTSTKQFVWCDAQRCEERDGSGSLSNGKQFYGLGQVNFASGTPTNYFYNLDHLGSVREMTKTVSGTTTIEAQYDYSPWGEVTKLAGSADSDCQYAGYYKHARSGLNLTLYRAYNPGLGRWISRDPLGESAGVNLYGYVGGNPLGFTDPLGLDPTYRDDFRAMVPGGRGQGSNPLIEGVLTGSTLLLAGYAIAGLEIPSVVAGSLGKLLSRLGLGGAAAAGASKSCPKESDVEKAMQAIENFLGPGYTKLEEGGSDLILRSADKLRQVRFDLTNSHGLQPHINIEVFRPRNLYLGDPRMILTRNEHFFPKK